MKNRVAKDKKTECRAKIIYQGQLDEMPEP